MMRATYLALLAACGVAAAGHAQTPIVCEGPKDLPADTLRAIARALHPEALTDSLRRAGVIIALVFDADCHLTHHSVGRRSRDTLSDGEDGTLRELFPAAGITTTSFGGIADAVVHAPLAPWIVWGVRTERAPAMRLEPADFVVAGIPDVEPYVDVSEDTARIRRILGAPRSIRRFPMKDDSLTTWQYDGLAVDFGNIARQGIRLTTPRVRTHRGLAVGDPMDRVIALYGRPHMVLDNEWVYSDPHEWLHVVTMWIRDGRVATIFVGNMWD